MTQDRWEWLRPDVNNSDQMSMTQDRWEELKPDLKDSDQIVKWPLNIGVISAKNTSSDGKKTVNKYIFR